MTTPWNALHSAATRMWPAALLLLLSATLTMLAALVLAPLAHERRKYRSVSLFSKHMRHRTVLLRTSTCSALLRLRDSPHGLVSSMHYATDAVLRAAVTQATEDTWHYLKRSNVVLRSVRFAHAGDSLRVSPLHLFVLVLPIVPEEYCGTLFSTRSCTPYVIPLPGKANSLQLVVQFGAVLL